MAVEFKKAIEEHRQEAAKYLKAHFGGEYPSYFKESVTEQCCIKDLTTALFNLERGKITPEAFNIELQKIYNHIDSFRSWDEAMFNRKPGEFPEFPDVERSKLN